MNEKLEIIDSECTPAIAMLEKRFCQYIFFLINYGKTLMSNDDDDNDVIKL